MRMAHFIIQEVMQPALTLTMCNLNININICSIKLK